MLPDTGERIIPDVMKPTNGMLLEHVARYYFATPYVKGRVLDLSCGVGYGAQMISKMCKKDVDRVVAVDNQPDVLQYARGRYHHPLIEWVQADALDSELPTKLGTFDTILSFETIEHLEDDRLFIEHLRQMLNPGGTLVLSTPFGNGRGKPTNEPFHVHQLTREEFVKLFDSFANVEFYYQRGVTFEPPREGVHYSFGVAVVQK